VVVITLDLLSYVVDTSGVDIDIDISDVWTSCVDNVVDNAACGVRIVIKRVGYSLFSSVIYMIASLIYISYSSLFQS